MNSTLPSDLQAKWQNQVLRSFQGANRVGAKLTLVAWGGGDVPRVRGAWQKKLSSCQTKLLCQLNLQAAPPAESDGMAD